MQRLSLTASASSPIPLLGAAPAPVHVPGGSGVPVHIHDGAWLRDLSFQSEHVGSVRLSHVTFEGCDFRGVSFMNSQLEHCSFIGCRFDEVMFVNAALTQTRFADCHIGCSSFEDASLDRCRFQRVNMPGTHFLQADAADSTITDSDLTDTVFFDEHLAGFGLDEPSRGSLSCTRPTVLVPVFPERRGLSTPMLYHQVRSRGANALRIAVQAQRVDPDALAREVDAVLSWVDPTLPTPVPQQLLQVARDQPDSCPAIGTVLAKVDLMLARADAVVFPGGEDVPPLLYGARPDARTDAGTDLRRSLLEYAVVDRIFHHRITPGLFVCRSSQIVATFFGAELVQHIGEDHRDHPRGRPVKRHIVQQPMDAIGHYGSVMPDAGTLTVAAYQHQGIPLEGRHRQVLDVWASSGIQPDGPASRQTIAQGLEARHWPVGATQFHGEFQNPPGDDPTDLAFAAGLSPENGQLFDTVMGGAWTHFRKAGVAWELIGSRVD